MIGARAGGMSPVPKCLRLAAVARYAIRAVTIGLLVALAAPAAGSAAALRGNGMIAFDRHRSGNWDIYVKAATRSARAFRITTNRAADFAPSFSPGGTRIAFSSNRGHNYDIYTTSTSGHQLRRITSNVAQDAFPSWSPNGRRIAFASNRGGDWEIYTVDANGSSKPVEITHHQGVDSLPVWSPDGTKIAFDSPRNGHYQICVVPATGGTVTVLTTGAFRNVQPAWSPDGSRIAFVSNRSGSFDVWVLTIASGNLRRLTTDSKAEFQPAWSPDGSRILFVRATAAGQTIDEMPVSGGPATALTGLRGNELPRWQPVAATTVTGVSPGQGPAAGGTSVTITGHNFGPAATVMFGSARAASVVVTSSTSMTATSPPGSGTVDVTVATSRGTSATSSADRFTYQ
jgi:Tol biopolymer transport system component